MSLSVDRELKLVTDETISEVEWPVKRSMLVYGW